MFWTISGCSEDDYTVLISYTYSCHTENTRQTRWDAGHEVKEKEAEPETYRIAIAKKPIVDLLRLLILAKSIPLQQYQHFSPLCQEKWRLTKSQDHSRSALPDALPSFPSLRSCPTLPTPPSPCEDGTNSTPAQIASPRHSLVVQRAVRERQSSRLLGDAGRGGFGTRAVKRGQVGELEIWSTTTCCTHDLNYCACEVCGQQRSVIRASRHRL